MFSMLPANHGGQRPIGKKLIDVITDASLTTNLRLVLDAGDSNSYTSGTKWLDVSGNGYDMTFGNATGASTDDPTFVGVVGHRGVGTYMSFDGGDYFEYDSANETWMNNLHKANSVFSSIAGLFTKSGSMYIWGTQGASSRTGTYWLRSTSQGIQFRNGASNLGQKYADDAISNDAWHFCGQGLGEADGDVSHFYLDGGPDQAGSADTFSFSVTGESTGNPGATFAVGAKGGESNAGVVPAVAGYRLMFLAVWTDTLITNANMDTMYADGLSARLGL